MSTMKINNITYNNNRSMITQRSSLNNGHSAVHFTGMTGKMKREMFIDGKKDILEIINKRSPEQNSYVGQLPAGMFNKLPENPEQRTAAIKEIMHAFDETAVEIRESPPDYGSPHDEYKNRRSKHSVEILKSVLEKYNLISPDKEFDIIYLGEGDYGKAYKLEGLYDEATDNELIIKVFRTADKDARNWHRYKSHGNYAEINTAAYWMDRFGKDTQRGIFYFGNIEAGYLIDNFIDNDKPLPKRFINEYGHGIKLTDEEMRQCAGHNKINYYSIDWGGVRIVNRIKNRNKTALYVLNRIKKTDPQYRSAEWCRIYNNKKLDETGKKAGLALSIKHLTENPDIFIQTCMNENIPEVDQALGYALKYLPYEKSKKLFVKLMECGDITTQVVLMNEIPLLARKQRIADKYDDLDVPKDEIDPKKLKVFYKIAEKYALAQSREHLASYVHLLPENDIMKEFNKLVKMQDNRVFDRLLHKMKVVREEEFPANLKLEMLKKLQTAVTEPYLKTKVQETKIFVIRSTLADD